MQTFAAARGIEIHLVPGPRPADCCVLADRRRLKQVLLNLLSNAIKYNRPQVGSTSACVGRRYEAHVAVTDSGFGITRKTSPGCSNPSTAFTSPPTSRALGWDSPYLNDSPA